MDIRAAEISAILKQQIQHFGAEAEVTEVGQVLSVGDGIARCYGLDKVQAGEMVEFPGGMRGMALNLDADNVGVVIFGDAVPLVLVRARRLLRLGGLPRRVGRRPRWVRRDTRGNRADDCEDRCASTPAEHRR